jgi:hypothetical protein
MKLVKTFSGGEPNYVTMPETSRDDIIRMAIDVGATGCANPDKWGILEISYENLERFAKLVTEYEREECAKWADLVAREIDNTNNTASYIASGIRERGNE